MKNLELENQIIDEPNYIYEQPAKQLILSKKQFKGLQIKDRGDMRTVKFVFQDRENYQLDGVENYLKSKLLPENLGPGTIEAFGKSYTNTKDLRKQKARYASVNSRIKSLRSQSELEFLSLEDRDPCKPRINRHLQAM